MLAFEDRLRSNSQRVQENSPKVNGVLREDKELLQIMANEVEYPQVLTGTFPAEFLTLPQEILINAMRKHQKYFCATDTRMGNFLPVFFTVLNTRRYRT